MGDYFNQAYEEAHQDYTKRKNEIISKLKTIKKIKDINKLPIEWIDQAIEFIKEKEM